MYGGAAVQIVLLSGHSSDVFFNFSICIFDSLMKLSGNRSFYRYTL